MSRLRNRTIAVLCLTVSMSMIACNQTQQPGKTMANTGKAMQSLGASVERISSGST